MDTAVGVEVICYNSYIETVRIDAFVLEESKGIFYVFICVFRLAFCDQASPLMVLFEFILLQIFQIILCDAIFAAKESLFLN